MPGWLVRNRQKRFVEPTLTQMVRMSFLRYNTERAAFKIIPRNRVPQIVFQHGGSVFKWGFLSFYSGGLLGSVMAVDLASRSRSSNVSSIYWDMEGDEDGKVHKLYSVVIKSSGMAEDFPCDPLILEHLPGRAEETLAAHVFHFFRQDEALLFESLVHLWIGDFADSLN